MTFGDRVLEARTALGLTQNEFAQQLGTSRERVNLWENNKGRAGPDYVDKLVVVTGRPHRFFQGDPTPTPAEIVEQLSGLRAAATAQTALLVEIVSLLREERDPPAERSASQGKR